MNDRSAALITGSSGGIGRALCAAFKQAGYFVIGCDVAAAETVSDQFLPVDLNRIGRNAVKRSDFLKLFESTLGKRCLKVLINNAALQHLGPFASLGVDALLETLHVNVLAPALLTQDLLPHLQRAHGSVINIGSVHAQATKPGFVAYATSKSALRGLTVALAVELGRDVRFNIIEPAAIATEMLLAGFHGDTDGLARLETFHPTGSIGQPQDVANLAVYLASDAANFINGAVLGVDGGIRGRLYDPV